MDTRIVFAVIFRIFLSGVPPVLVKNWMRGRREKGKEKRKKMDAKSRKEMAYVTKKKPEVAVQRGNASRYV
jgi:hypothetical protein